MVMIFQRRNVRTNYHIFYVIRSLMRNMVIILFMTNSTHQSRDKHVTDTTLPASKPVVSPANNSNLAQQPVTLNILDQYIVLDNGIVQITLSKPGGSVTGIKYNGVDNLLDEVNGEGNRGYWDLVWVGNGSKGKKGSLDRLQGTEYKVILQNEEQIEISFTRTWNFSQDGKAVPLNFDKRYILLRGSSGFYTYGTYERLNGWPDFQLTNTRVSLKLNRDKFKYMVVADNRQRYMPLLIDRSPERGQALAYPEAVKLVNPVEPEFKGEVDDKYQYSIENKDNRVHGWISTNPPMGLWQITPSDEFRSGGPVKQCLTSHVGPTTLAIFHSTHYSGADLIMEFSKNESWKKVYGPVFFHLNTLSTQGDPLYQLWQNAKKQMEVEVESWPYKFPQSEEYPKSDQRGSISGKLLVFDSYVSKYPISASGAYVGLAAPGAVGSWQREAKGYQFWTETDKDGNFRIDNIRVGNYSIYGWVPGFIGDYQYVNEVGITPGAYKEMGELVYKPPRTGPTLWEIGTPDRSAAEFFVPDTNPAYVNKLYVNHPQKFRQYGLWERYTDLYPINDLIYTVGIDDYRKDWFFVQVARKTSNTTYADTTWQIEFSLENRIVTQTYALRIALATAHFSELQVRINKPNEKIPLFTSGVIGKDNTIARHGIHGLYWQFNIEIPGSELLEGHNTIFLTRTNTSSPFQGIMYDYIRLEAPAAASLKH